MYCKNVCMDGYNHSFFILKLEGFNVERTVIIAKSYKCWNINQHDRL